MSTANKHKFQAQTQKILKIITHSLYKEDEIFLRELISNASDALNKVRLRKLQDEPLVDPELDMKVEIIPEEDNNILRVVDTGVGMTKNELIENLGTIAQSGTEQFLEAIESGDTSDDSLIGMFGVGFYSAFLVADKVEVNTRAASPSASSWKWISDGDESFSIEEGTREKRGTEIILHLKEDKDEYLQGYRLRSLVKQYSNYIQFPIYLIEEDEEEETEEEEDEEPQPINAQKALWRTNPDEVEEEEYTEFYHHLGNAGDPMATIHINVDVPFQFYAVLFIPAVRPQNWNNESEWGLTLYNRKVLINENNKDLLPEYLRFVEGVVDAEDLRLNVSREVLQNNRAQRTIKKYIQKKIIEKMEEIEENEEEFIQFFNQFGPYIKEGIAANDKNKDKLIELLRFHSTEVSGLTSLQEYVERMKVDQEKIYYLTGLELDILKKSPHLEYYEQNDLEVLLLGEPIDSFLMMHLNEYHDYEFFLIDQDEDDDQEPPTADEEGEEDEEDKKKTGPYAPVLNRTLDVLGDDIADVKTSDRLVNSIARLVTSKGGVDSNMQRAMKIMEAQGGQPGMNMPMMGKTLQLNPDHDIVQKLNTLIQENPDDERIDLMIRQIHDNARISDGDVPDFSNMLGRLENIMDFAVNDVKSAE